MSDADDFKLGIEWLRGLPEGQQSSIASSFDEAMPQMTLDRYSQTVAVHSGLEGIEGINHIRAIVFWFAEFVESAAADADFKKRLCGFAAGGNASDVAECFEKILSAPSFLLTKKAQDVMWGHGRVFKDAQVISQIRPVFLSDLSLGSDHAVIVHELRMDAMNGNENETWRIAMDSQRARVLIAVLERAIEKETLLRKKSDFTYLAD